MLTPEEWLKNNETIERGYVILPSGFSVQVTDLAVIMTKYADYIFKESRNRRKSMRFSDITRETDRIVTNAIGGEKSNRGVK